VRLTRIGSGHYETEDGKSAVWRERDRWYVASVETHGVKPPLPPGRGVSSKREAAASLAFRLAQDRASH
jgi:hypothetical protein